MFKQKENEKVMKSANQSSNLSFKKLGAKSTAVTASLALKAPVACFGVPSPLATTSSTAHTSTCVERVVESEILHGLDKMRYF